MPIYSCRLAGGMQKSPPVCSAVLMISGLNIGQRDWIAFRPRKNSYRMECPRAYIDIIIGTIIRIETMKLCCCSSSNTHLAPQKSWHDSLKTEPCGETYIEREREKKNKRKRERENWKKACVTPCEECGLQTESQQQATVESSNSPRTHSLFPNVV